jgi:hypothetical protein
MRASPTDQDVVTVATSVEQASVAVTPHLRQIDEESRACARFRATHAPAAARIFSVMSAD